MTSWILALLLAGASSQGDTLAIVDAVVLDGRGGAPLEGGTILVRGRPDRDVSATRRVDVVVRGGRVLDRDLLKFDPARDPGFRESLPVSSHP